MKLGRFSLDPAYEYQKHQAACQGNFKVRLLEQAA